MVCMIVGETFKRLIRMNDRLDVTVSWEGPNPRPGDCRLMLPRFLSFYFVLSPFLFFQRFSHLLLSPRPFSSYRLPSSCLLLSSLRITFRLPFRRFREARNCFPKRRRRGSLIRGFTRTNYREISYVIISLNVPLPLDILSTHANYSHVGWQMRMYE